MSTIENVAIKVGQINDFMYFVESAMIDADGAEGGEETRRLHNMVYLLMDMLEGLENDVDELDGHRRVCDAIYAVNHVNQMKAEIERLRAAVKNSAEIEERESA